MTRFLAVLMVAAGHCWSVLKQIYLSGHYPSAAVELVADSAVRAVVQPGGSVRDEEVIAAAQKGGIAMFFTGTRHFSHA
jgi:hypothetical protein